MTTNAVILTKYAKLESPLTERAAYGWMYGPAYAPAWEEEPKAETPNDLYVEAESIAMDLEARAVKARGTKERLLRIAATLRTLPARADAFKVAGDRWLSEHRVELVKLLRQSDLGTGRIHLRGKRGSPTESHLRGDALYDTLYHQGIPTCEVCLRDGYYFVEAIKANFGDACPITSAVVAEARKIMKALVVTGVTRKWYKRNSHSARPSIMSITADRVIAATANPDGTANMSAPESIWLMFSGVADHQLRAEGIPFVIGSQPCPQYDMPWHRRPSHTTYYPRPMIAMHHRLRVERIIQRQLDAEAAAKAKLEADGTTHRERCRQDVVQAIVRLFPGMDQAEADGIAAFACSRGTRFISAHDGEGHFRQMEIGYDRVGLSADLTVDDRAFFAVWAHLRHTKTNYEQRLRELWDAKFHVGFGDGLMSRDEVAISRREDADDNKETARAEIRDAMDAMVAELGCTYRPSKDVDGYYAEIGETAPTDRPAQQVA